MKLTILTFLCYLNAVAWVHIAPYYYELAYEQAIVDDLNAPRADNDLIMTTFNQR